MPTVHFTPRTSWRVRGAFERRLHDAIRDAAAETETIVDSLEKENAQLKAEIMRLQTELADAHGHLATWKGHAVRALGELRDLKKSAA